MKRLLTSVVVSLAFFLSAAPARAAEAQLRDVNDLELVVPLDVPAGASSVFFKDGKILSSASKDACVIALWTAAPQARRIAPGLLQVYAISDIGGTGPRPMPARRPHHPPPPPPHHKPPTHVRAELNDGAVDSVTCPLLAGQAQSTFATVEKQLEGIFRLRITPMPVGKVTGSRAVAGFFDPGALFLDGGTLYVANNQNNTKKLVTVVDVSRPGAEKISGTIATPVNPNDLTVVEGTIYVVDENRDKLHYRALTGGAWGYVALAPHGWDFNYGGILARAGHLVFVLHTSERSIDVVDTRAKKVVRQLTGIGVSPSQLEVAGDRLLVQAQDGITALALSDFHVVYHIALTGRPGTTRGAIAVRGDRLFANVNNGLVAYDARDGRELARLSVGRIGRRMVAGDAGLFFQVGTDIALVSAGLRHVCDRFQVLRTAQKWYPPLEKMAASADGRVFATNRNDDSLVVLDPVGRCQD